MMKRCAVDLQMPVCSSIWQYVMSEAFLVFVSFCGKTLCTGSADEVAQCVLPSLGSDWFDHSSHSSILQHAHAIHASTICRSAVPS